MVYVSVLCTYSLFLIMNYNNFGALHLNVDFYKFVAELLNKFVFAELFHVREKMVYKSITLWKSKAP